MYHACMCTATPYVCRFLSRCANASFTGAPGREDDLPSEIDIVQAPPDDGLDRRVRCGASQHAACVIRSLPLGGESGRSIISSSKHPAHGVVKTQATFIVTQCPSYLFVILQFAFPCWVIKQASFGVALAAGVSRQLVLAPLFPVDIAIQIAL